MSETSTPRPNSPEARDVASVIHPLTNLKTHLEQGPVEQQPIAICCAPFVVAALRLDFDIAKPGKFLYVLLCGLSRVTQHFCQGGHARPAPTILVTEGAQGGENAKGRRAQAPVLNGSSRDD